MDAHASEQKQEDAGVSCCELYRVLLSRSVKSTQGKGWVLVLLNRSQKDSGVLSIALVGVTTHS